MNPIPHPTLTGPTLVCSPCAPSCCRVHGSPRVSEGLPRAPRFWGSPWVSPTRLPLQDIRNPIALYMFFRLTWSSIDSAWWPCVCMPLKSVVLTYSTGRQRWVVASSELPLAVNTGDKRIQCGLNTSAHQPACKTHTCREYERSLKSTHFTEKLVYVHMPTITTCRNMKNVIMSANLKTLRELW